MKSLTLFNQPIRIGEDGMICLTDMWKASGKSESESPYHYLRNKQTKEFLAELEKNHESVVFTERGVHGGTYGGKFVAYDYAAWLNPGFKYAAYKVLDDYFTGELQHRNSL
ncbi:KilA-N domain-containing protein, partial [Shigella sonnei]